MGLEQSQVAAIAEQWPNVDIHSTEVRLAVNNAMNNLLGDPHHEFDAWLQYISASAVEVERVLAKWRVLVGEVDGDSKNRYFNRMH